MTFKPGQMVWHNGNALVYRGVECEDSQGRRYVFDSIDELIAISAPIEPQKCPFCGEKAVDSGSGNSFFVACDVCDFAGPYKPTHEEAIAAWNSIRVDGNRQETLDNSGRKMCPECKWTIGFGHAPHCKSEGRCCQCGVPGKYPYCGPCGAERTHNMSADEYAAKLAGLQTKRR